MRWPSRVTAHYHRLIEIGRAAARNMEPMHKTLDKFVLSLQVKHSQNFDDRRWANTKMSLWSASLSLLTGS